MIPPAPAPFLCWLPLGDRSGSSQLRKSEQISGQRDRGPCGIMRTACTLPFQEDTISINHNWVNGCNLGQYVALPRRAMLQQEVIEWRDTMPDWHHHCQVGQLV